MRRLGLWFFRKAVPNEKGQHHYDTVGGKRVRRPGPHPEEVATITHHQGKLLVNLHRHKKQNRAFKEHKESLKGDLGGKWTDLKRDGQTDWDTSGWSVPAHKEAELYKVFPNATWIGGEEDAQSENAPATETFRIADRTQGRSSTPGVAGRASVPRVPVQADREEPGEPVTAGKLETVSYGEELRPVPTMTLDETVKGALLRGGDPFQVADTEQILSAFDKGKEGYLLANDTGTGKTFIALAAIAHAKPKSALIVVPNRQLADKWASEAKATFGLDVTSASLREASGDGIFVTTYTDMRSGEGAKREWDWVVFDEAHNMIDRNLTGKKKTQQYTAGMELGQKAMHCLYMTATPFQQIWDLKYLEKLGLWKNFSTFLADHHVKLVEMRVPRPGKLRRGPRPKWGDKDDGGQMTITVPQHKGGVEDHIAVFRRLNELGIGSNREVRLDEKLVNAFAQIDLTDEQTRTYRDMLAAYDEAIATVPPDQSKPLYLQRIAAARRLLQEYKLDEGIRLAKELLKQGKSVSLFVAYKSEGDIDVSRFIPEVSRILPLLQNPMDRILRELGGPAKVGQVHGDASAGNRTVDIDAFQSGKKRALIATIASGGTGLSLHDTTGKNPRAQINIVLPWAGSEFKQLAGRSHRLGSKSETEQYWLLTDLPEERHMASIVAGKLKNMGAMVKGIEQEDDARTLAEFDLMPQSNGRSLMGFGKAVRKSLHLFGFRKALPVHIEGGAGSSHKGSHRRPGARFVPPPQARQESAHEEGVLQSIPLDKIDPNPWQNRKDFAEEALKELADSIVEQGLLQPISVRVHPTIPGRFQIIGGERRFRAHQIVNLPEIKAIVYNQMSDEGMGIMALIENVARKDVKPMEEAEGYGRLIDEHGLTVAQLAKQVGVIPATVERKLSYNRLIPEVQKLLRTGQMPESVAAMIARLESPASQGDVFAAYGSRGLTPSQVRAMVNAKLMGEGALGGLFAEDMEEELRKQEEAEYGKYKRETGKAWEKAMSTAVGAVLGMVDDETYRVLPTVLEGKLPATIDQVDQVIAAFQKIKAELQQGQEYQRERGTMVGYLSQRKIAKKELDIRQAKAEQRETLRRIEARTDKLLTYRYLGHLRKRRSDQLSANDKRNLRKWEEEVAINAKAAAKLRAALGMKERVWKSWGKRSENFVKAQLGFGFGPVQPTHLTGGAGSSHKGVGTATVRKAVATVLLNGRPARARIHKSLAGRMS